MSPSTPAAFPAAGSAAWSAVSLPAYEGGCGGVVFDFRKGFPAAFSDPALPTGRTMFNASGDLTYSLENLFDYSEDITQLTNGQISGVTEDNASDATFPAGSAYIYWRDGATAAYPAGTRFTVRCKVSSPGVSKNKIGVRFSSRDNGANSVSQSVTLTTTPTEYTLILVLDSSIAGISDGSAIEFGLDNRIAFGGDELAGTVRIEELHLERHGSFRGYIPTNGAAVYKPRTKAHYYDSAWKNGGLLVEEARTNLFTNSTKLGYAANWPSTTHATTRTPNNATDLFGVANNADTIEDTSAAQFQGIQQTVSHAASAQFCLTGWYLQDANNDDFPTQQYEGGVGSGAISTATGAVAVVDGVADQLYSVDHDRYWQLNLIDVELGNGFNTCFFYPAISEDLIGQQLTATRATSYGHAQYELGSFPTSPIPTPSTTATRSADSPLSTTRIPINADAGSVIVEFYDPHGDLGTVNRTLFSISDASVNNQIFLEYAGPNTGNFTIYDGAFSAAVAAVSPSVGDHKYGVGWDADEAVFYSDGVLRGSDNTVSLPTGLNTLDIGQRWNDLFHANLFIKTMTYYPRKLSSAEFVGATS